MQCKCSTISNTSFDNDFIYNEKKMIMKVIEIFKALSKNQNVSNY